MAFTSFVIVTSEVGLSIIKNVMNLASVPLPSFGLKTLYLPVMVNLRHSVVCTIKPMYR